MPLLTNMLQVLILLMIAIQQKTSTLGGTRPLQIPLKEKTVFNGELGFKSPQRDLTENLPVLLAFQTSLSSISLSNCTLDRITYILARSPVFLPLKTLFQEKIQHHAWPSHILILSRLASLSLNNWNSVGNFSAKLPLSV